MNVKYKGKQFTACPGSSLLESLAKSGFILSSTCAGKGKCGECRVLVLSGEEFLSERSEAETSLPERQRLACQAKILGKEGLIECSPIRDGQWRIEGSGCGDRLPQFSFQPAVQVSEGEVFLAGVNAGPFRGNIFGAALDIGTSTVVLRILDLNSGAMVSNTCFKNPQDFAGSDVISRISHASTHGARNLRAILVEAVNREIVSSGIDPHNLYELAVAGNPAMRDIFLGLDVSCLGQDPFYSSLEAEVRQGIREKTSIILSPESMGLEINPRGRIYGLPLPGCHVGADISAGILASGLAVSERKSVLMDLGTNSEIVVNNGLKMVAASCPAGPAFEGGMVRCGMPGVAGAVESVRILPEARMEFRVIDGVLPSGFCGSGLISLLGELRKNRLINTRGRFSEDQELSRSDRVEPESTESAGTQVRRFWFERPSGRPKRLVVEGPEGLFIDEEDLSRLLQAKGAITAGLKIALRRSEMVADDIDRFYLAGAFGRYLDLQSAVGIGLLPDAGAGKFVCLGNSSIEGASIALLSVDSRRFLEEVVSGIEHLELEAEPDFFAMYADGCLLER